MTSSLGTVLLVEDDLNILRINRNILEWEGFTVLCAETLVKARALLTQYTPDVLVLDIRLPDGSGLTFCEEIRSTTLAPVLFLTALDEKSEIIKGLLAGGNDYITKPYDVDEFLARIKAQLQLAKMNREAVANVKIMERPPFKMDLVAMRAYLEEEDMLLSAREFSVLLFLLKNEGKVLSPEEIYEGAWAQPMSGNPYALWKCISRLKSKLQPVEGKVSLINFRKKGYLLEIIQNK